ncbi:hypothetical protein [Nocardioides xinjiangensis]|uniref:hypothetical protein n=1 Tax=Nocardioides xinjiangensis TaxID=2817376 RepID=UPI001B30BB08|nr:MULTISPECIES: hypothetical protein [unclassified Nocardioides]
MTNHTSHQTPLDSTKALLSHRDVTWREASEGSATLAAAIAASIGVVVLAKLTRALLGERR